MKNVILALGLFLASNLSWADHNQSHQCAMKAWQAASPTTAQNNAARSNFAPVKQMYAEKKAAIDSAMQELMGDLKAHPISKEEVKASCHSLMRLVAPIQEAAISATIDTINLLTPDQREDFDDAIGECMNDYKILDLSGIRWDHINLAISF